MHRFAGKRRFGDVNVGREEDDIGGRDFGGGQGVLGSERTLGFDPNFVAHGGGGAFQRFGRHEGVSDPGWAGGNSNKSFHNEKILRSLSKDIESF